MQAFPADLAKAVRACIFTSKTVQLRKKKELFYGTEIRRGLGG
jgi:hypothetical protein